MVELVVERREGRFDVGEIHHHAAIRRAFRFNEFTLKRDLQHIPMAVQITALAAVIGNAVTRIEFEFSGNRQHGKSGNVQILVGLHRQAPLRMAFAPVDRELRVEIARRAVHRLDEEILEVELRILG